MKASAQAVHVPGFAVEARRRRPASRWVMVALVCLAPTLALTGLLGLTNRSSVTARAGEGWAALPATARGQISAMVGADEPGYRVRDVPGGYLASAGRLRTSFRAGAVVVRGGTAQAAIGLTAIGDSSALSSVALMRPSARGNRVSYTAAGVSEVFANGPAGLEQSFTVDAAPSPRSASLVLQLAGSGATRSAASGGAVVLARSGSASLLYGGLLAVDARGRALPSRFDIRQGHLSIRVDARGARYPVRVDPLVQLGEKLAEHETNLEFGASVSLSAEGQTAIVGAPRYGGSERLGAAWVFTRSGSTWTQQAKLTEIETKSSTPVPGTEFGRQVSISSDGNTAIVAEPGYEEFESSPPLERGAVWVFTRSGSSWSAQAKLRGTEQHPVEPSCASPTTGFGATVALSGDGNTALAGGPMDSNCVGAVWVFTRSGTTWSQQGHKLVDTAKSADGLFGGAVTLSSDGSTALIGGSMRSIAGSQEAAWVWTRSGTTWSQQAELQGTGREGAADFGESVALAGDGNTALVGGGSDASLAGAAWVFTREGSSWSQQGSKLVAPHEGFARDFGTSVALSASGNLALIGQPQFDSTGEAKALGRAFDFTRSGSTWTRLEPSLQGTGELGQGQFGASVALAPGGDTAMIGGPFDTNGEFSNQSGAVWTFAIPLPAVTAIKPARGPAAGGTEVAITGTNLADAAQVSFGATPAASFKVLSETSIIAISPKGSGTVDVTVRAPAGTSATGEADRFTYEAGATITSVKLKAKGSPSKSPTVTVKGSGFGTQPTAYSAESTACAFYGPANGDWWGLKPENHLWFIDQNTFEEWSAGAGNAEGGDCIGIVLKKWTPTKVVFKFGNAYGSFAHWTVFKGDEFKLAVAGAFWTGKAT